jgi:hypothetical protein
MKYLYLPTKSFLVLNSEENPPKRESLDYILHVTLPIDISKKLGDCKYENYILKETNSYYLIHELRKNLQISKDLDPCKETVLNFIKNKFNDFPEFNNLQLLRNIQDELSYILLAMDNEEKEQKSVHRTHSFFGLGSDYFIINNTANTDTRAMKNFSRIHTLYQDPFEETNDYGISLGLRPWVISGSSVLQNPLKRKIYNISGVDTFIFLKETYESNKQKNDGWIEIPSGELPEIIDPKISIVKDTKGYGIAYLAKKLKFHTEVESLINSYFPLYVPANVPDEVFKKAQTINDYLMKTPLLSSFIQKNLISTYEFRKSNTEKYNLLKKYLYSELLALENKHDIIIESQLNESNFLPGTKENFLKILNIAGNKAMFEVECFQPECLLVFNMGAVRGWKAFVDKEAAKIHTVNFAFMGVEVPSGKHKVWFEYRRAEFIYSILACLFLLLFISLLGAGILILNSKENKWIKK